jgi:TetR/AcrR family transcriptional regulator
MTTNRKQLEREQRRLHLLDAAARVFGRKPFDEASMHEVAAEADVGMQGLYEHFPSKQELYEQVVLRRAETFSKQADEILQRSAPPLEQLHQLGRAYVQLFMEQPWHVSTFERSRVDYDWDVTSRFGARLRSVYERERTNVRTLIVHAVSKGNLRRLDPDFLTQLFIDVIHTSLHHSLRRRPGESAEQCTDRALDVLLQGIGGHS